MKSELVSSKASKTPYSLNNRNKNNIKQLIEKAMSYNYPDNISNGEIQSMFENLFSDYPDLEIIKFQEIAKRELGFVVSSHAIARVVNRWNQISPNGRNIDIEPVLAIYKKHLYEILSNFISALESTSYLKNTFDACWKNSVRNLIDNYNGNEAFGTDTHTAFIGFLQEVIDGRNFIKRLDESFGAIWKATSKRKTLYSKLKDPARYLSTYLGTVFEIFIVAPCASSGILSDYEPKAGSNKAEALIKVKRSYLLVEATVMTGGRDINFCGAIDIEEYSNKICLKIKDKAEQLKNSNYPVILFIAPPLISPPELKLGLQKALQSGKCNNIAGIVVSDDYKAHYLKLVKNSNCTYLVVEEVWASLVNLYALRPLQIENIWE